MRLIELLFPQVCPGCDEVLGKDEKKIGFCKQCQKSVRLIGKDYCLFCGAPLADETASLCKNCAGKEHKLKQNKAIFRYSGVMKTAMYRFKYSNRRCYARTFAGYAKKCHSAWIKQNEIEAIIPVPMYKPKERKRGYNQATEFAKALGKELAIPVETDAVVRIRDTKPMKEISGLERKKNLQTAFKLIDNDVKFKKVLLVDDIYTTGATMEEVASVLLAGGVESVYGMSICIGESD